LHAITITALDIPIKTYTIKEVKAIIIENLNPKKIPGYDYNQLSSAEAVRDRNKIHYPII